MLTRTDWATALLAEPLELRFQAAFPPDPLQAKRETLFCGSDGECSRRREQLAVRDRRDRDVIERTADDGAARQVK